MLESSSEQGLLGTEGCLGFARCRSTRPLAALRHQISALHLLRPLADLAVDDSLQAHGSVANRHPVAAAWSGNIWDRALKSRMVIEHAVPDERCVEPIEKVANALERERQRLERIHPMPAVDVADSSPTDPKRALPVIRVVC